MAVTEAKLPAGGETREIAKHSYRADIASLSVSFLARDLATGAEYVLEGSDLETRHVPWSTFKIPNLVLALETGVAPSLEAWRTWDAGRRPAADHWPDE